MTLEQCTATLLPLALALRAEVDGPTFAVYHRVLASVPPRLLQAAIDSHLQQGTSRFFPTAPELLGLCEAERQRQLAAQPWTPCRKCARTNGWIELTDPQGVTRVMRCPCVRRHALDLAKQGLPVAPLLLEALRQEPVVVEEPHRPMPAGELATLLTEIAAKLGRAKRMAPAVVQTDLEGRPLP